MDISTQEEQLFARSYMYFREGGNMEEGKKLEIHTMFVELHIKFNNFYLWQHVTVSSIVFNSIQLEYKPGMKQG